MNERKIVRCPQCGTLVSSKGYVLVREENPTYRRRLKKKKKEVLECPICGIILNTSDTCKGY